MNSQTSVFVVDDDQAMRNSLKWLIESVGMKVETFASADEFIRNYYPGRAGCLLLDVRMPGMGGLELQENLAAHRCGLPVIIITGHGDVPMAVRAVQNGAVDFLEKPFNNQAMLDSVHRAIEVDAKQRGESSRLQEIEARYDMLTPREKEVMQLVIEGMRNKNIAYDLEISQSTVEVHRSRVMEKMQAKTLSDLMRMSLAMDLLKND